MSRYYHPDHDFWAKRKLPVPSVEMHGTEEDISAHMTKLKPTMWKLEGNKLIGETEMGQLVNFIPSNYILLGTGEDGLPILKEIGI